MHISMSGSGSGEGGGGHGFLGRIAERLRGLGVGFGGRRMEEAVMSICSFISRPTVWGFFSKWNGMWEISIGGGED